MDNDNIQLPPRPPFLGAPGMDQWIDDLCRAAIRYNRERRAKQEAVPVGCSVNIRLMSDATVRQVVTGGADCNAIEWTRVTLHWTADGKAWIESEVNRELARILRREYPSDYFIYACADALDGGE